MAKLVNPSGVVKKSGKLPPGRRESAGPSESGDSVVEDTHVA
jgi:hypothetical protein